MIELVREPQVAPVEIPAPIYLHLRRLTDAGGLYEHAEGDTPRQEHGYCLDDVARALVVVCRETGGGRAGRPPRAVPDVRAGGAGARRPVPQSATVPI